jgi:hypothetical protein
MEVVVELEMMKAPAVEVALHLTPVECEGIKAWNSNDENVEHVVKTYRNGARYEGEC